MINKEFWILIGTVSTTLSVFTFIGLSIFYDRTKGHKKIREDYNLEGPISAIVYEKIIINFMYFLFPLLISIIALTDYKFFSSLFLIIPCLFISGCVYYKLWRYKKIKGGFLEIHLSCIIIIILLSFILFLLISILTKTQIQFGLIEIFAIVSIWIGLFFSIHTLIYFEKNIAIFKISKKTIYKVGIDMDELNDDIKEQLKNCKNSVNFEEEVAKKRLENLSKLSHKAKSIKSDIDKLLEEHYISLSEINDKIDDIDEIKRELAYEKNFKK